MAYGQKMTHKLTVINTVMVKVEKFVIYSNKFDDAYNEAMRCHLEVQFW